MNIGSQSWPGTPGQKRKNERQPTRLGLATSPRAGAVTVELALVAPVFLFLVFGIIEVGRGFMVSHLLANAAREGCRFGILENSDSEEIKKVVTNRLHAEGFYTATIDVTVNRKDAAAISAVSGDKMSVLVSIPVKDFTWYPGGNFLSGTISGQFTMRRE